MSILEAAIQRISYLTLGKPMYFMRKFNPAKDLEMIQGWCRAYGEYAPTLELITDTSYIFEINSIPTYFISLIHTNANWCYLENFCGNPEFKGKREAAMPYFIAELEAMAKKGNYKAMMTQAYRPKLVEQFKKYGFEQGLTGITSFFRRVA